MAGRSGVRRAAGDVDLEALGSTVVDLTAAVDALTHPVQPVTRERAKTALRPARPPRHRRKRASPPADESAYFDPTRSDFASLVKKLNEVLGED